MIIKRNGVQRYIDKDFAKFLDEIKEMRLKLEKDDLKSIKADWRITLAMVRHPSLKKIKEDIINSSLE